MPMSKFSPIIMNGTFIDNLGNSLVAFHVTNLNFYFENL